MHRFFARRENLTNSTVQIDGDSARHMLRVLRMVAGDRFVVVDPDGFEHLALVKETDSSSLSAALLTKRSGESEAPLSITLAVALLKGDKLDLVIQKATELGVCKIIPVICERSVSRVSPAKVVQRTQRWQRIADSAAAQSGRCALPLVEQPQWLASAVSVWQGLAVMAYEGETEKGLNRLLSTAPQSAVTLFTGPEGGFTCTEVELARAAGVVTVGLGPRILRAETAPLALLTAFMLQWGDLGNPASPIFGGDMPT